MTGAEKVAIRRTGIRDTRSRTVIDPAVIDFPFPGGVSRIGLGIRRILNEGPYDRWNPLAAGEVDDPPCGADRQEGSVDGQHLRSASYSVGAGRAAHVNPSPVHLDLQRGSLAELVILSRKRIDCDAPKSACQSATSK